MQNYVILNTEQSEVSKDPFGAASLIKIEALKLDKNFNELGKFLVYIKPEIALTKEMEEKTHLTNAFLNKTGIPLKEALEKFLVFIEDSLLIGYNTNLVVFYLLKGIYDTKVEDHKIDFISMLEYIKYVLDLKKEIGKLSLENVATYYHIVYQDIVLENLKVKIELLKCLLEKEDCHDIEEFSQKNIPKFFLPGLSKRNTKVKVRFFHGKTKDACRGIEFIDKTEDRKVSYLTHYNAIQRRDTTFYELLLYKKWGAKTMDDFMYINVVNLEYMDYYCIWSAKDLSIEKEDLEKMKKAIPYLEQYNIKLKCIGPVELLKENYQALGQENVTKLLENLKK